MCTKKCVCILIETRPFSFFEFFDVEKCHMKFVLYTYIKLEFIGDDKNLSKKVSYSNILLVREIY